MTDIDTTDIPDDEIESAPEAEEVEYEAASVDDLLGQSTPERWVDLDDLGKRVKVRGLTRPESITVSEIENVTKRDRQMVVMGMVEPAMTFDQVVRWGKSAASGQIERVTEAINELSGFGEGQNAEERQRFREG